MNQLVRLTTSIFALSVLASTAGAAPPWQPPPGQRVGEVHLESSCNRSIQQELDRGIALLHSFAYEQARISFEDVSFRDPLCAIAQWGIAMTLWRPLWGPLGEQDRKEGLRHLDRARWLGGMNEIERGLIDAITVVFEDGRTDSARPRAPGRLERYERALERLHARFPDDVEVASFYALALLAGAPAGDPNLARQRDATAILERMLAEHPRHPGVLHYLIHGYDFPELAHRGLKAARAYQEIAPDVPHAQHAPAHIYARLGLWPDVIDASLKALEAARHVERRMPLAAGPMSAHERLHALDFLSHAYLQRGQDRDAIDVRERSRTLALVAADLDARAAYAIGSIPARVALERKEWDEAADLSFPPLDEWRKFPFARAQVEAARAIALARLGDARRAREATSRLSSTLKSITDPTGKAFARRAEVMARVAEGWTAHAEGRIREANRILRRAADEDDALAVHQESPGPLIPARELYADFLLETDRPSEALSEYTRTLDVHPRRFNTLAGAARSAEIAGDTATARRMYRELLEVAHPDSQRPEIARARSFIARPEG